ncbi:MAG: Na+/H+ antiporter NhaC family protein [Paludibacteraceae bacterium]|nr:Na+/H+ antiporter NhaC family protein [Paludibacteraceae bacterium]
MKRGLIALSPILAMVVLLIVLSVYSGGVSNAPLLLIFVLTAIVAVLSVRGMKFSERVALFSQGAGNKDLLLMVWIFMLAGAFAASAKQMGAAGAMVDLTLQFLPARFALAGLFIAACLTSLCMGTSVGTIVALMPIATGLAERTDMTVPIVVAAVVGGAFFGDNLSLISDTTIVSTQSQGCRLSDKFRFNLKMVLPVALIACALYLFMGSAAAEHTVAASAAWWKVLPYIAVLAAAAGGVNVLIVLVLGNLLTCLTGIIDGSYDLMGWIQSTLQGVMGMSELILISMMAGGIFAIISYNGGMEFVINRLTRRVKTYRGAELSICALVAFANICTANNTVAILSVGGIARRVAEQYDIDPRRSASLLDTTSCCVQGLLPYGAQLLMASGLAGISAMSIIPYLFYPMLLAIAVLATIVIRRS